MQESQILQKMSNTIRFLAADTVQQANSGHPGMPMGMADILTVFSAHYKHNPKNPKWLNRDRVVFSGGHGSALIYSMLHLWGYDVSLDNLKNFRQLGSNTAGHPEYGHIDGVEVTTGPLGQGFANAVGFAMAAKYAAHILNDKVAKVIDHKVYCFCGDGDLQEGISYESASIAGHNKLDNLVVVYDSNDITIEGDLSVAFSENVAKRFEAQGWKSETIDGHDFEAIDAAFIRAKKTDCPYLIIARTKIGKGSASMEGSHHTHGAPLGAEEIQKSKSLANFDHQAFSIPDDVLIRFRCAIEKGDLEERSWNKLLIELPEREKGDLLNRLKSPDFSSVNYPSFETGKKVATRDSNGQILNAIASAVPSFIGGSADLAPSNKTELKGMGDFPNGKNIHYGIREHAMGAITNAISLYGLFAPFCSTFFVFSDYLKPSIRVAALMKAKAFFVFTHDSIGVGEDGPTHQPIEHLTSLRALPNLLVFRPADANENIEAWKSALNHDGPSAFVLSRQGLTIIDQNSSFGDMSKGGYLVKKSEAPKITILATGSEVEIALNTANKLAGEGINVNVASIPCFELFVASGREYQNLIIDPSTKVLAVEAASGIEWYRFADDVLCMESFGASGKDSDLFKHFGFTAENIADRAKKLL